MKQQELKELTTRLDNYFNSQEWLDRLALEKTVIVNLVPVRFTESYKDINDNNRTHTREAQKYILRQKEGESTKDYELDKLSYQVNKDFKLEDLEGVNPFDYITDFIYNRLIKEDIQCCGKTMLVINPEVGDPLWGPYSLGALVRRLPAHLFTGDSMSESTYKEVLNQYVEVPNDAFPTIRFSVIYERFATELPG